MANSRNRKVEVRNKDLKEKKNMKGRLRLQKVEGRRQKLVKKNKIQMAENRR